MICKCESCGKEKIVAQVTPVYEDGSGRNTFPGDVYWCRECVRLHFDNVVQFIAIL